MAFYQRFMLAPLKLTQRPDAARMLVYRGVATTRQQEPSASNGDSIGSEQEPSASAEENMGQELSVDSSETTVVQDFLPDSPPIIDEPTHHELQSKANVRGWEQLRSRFYLYALNVVQCHLDSCVSCVRTRLNSAARNVDR